LKPSFFRRLAIFGVHHVQTSSSKAPSLLCAFTLAPAEISCSTMAAWPFSAAICSTVLPHPCGDWIPELDLAPGTLKMGLAEIHPDLWKLIGLHQKRL
jgi:hypothetical protein